MLARGLPSYGEPLAPRAELSVPLGEEVPIEVPEAISERAPDFRFLLTRTGGAVVPWGFLGGHGLLHRLEEPWHGAVGDIVALDPSRARATFARVNPVLRSRAEGELRRWAEADGWTLEIMPDEWPLVRLPGWKSTVGDESPRCPACGANWLTDENVRGFSRRGFFLTHCRACRHGRVFPYGLVRRERCGEAKGSLVEGFAGEVEHPSATCICEGILCRRCQRRRLHRPTSNYFNERDGTVWHVPHFSGLVCDDCCRADRERT